VQWLSVWWPVLLLILLSWRRRYYENSSASFYQGTLNAPLEWLGRLNARYVVWAAQDQARAPQAFAHLQTQLAGHYDWRPLIRSGGVEYGIFVRH
jgi:hypothetical protein